MHGLRHAVHNVFKGAVEQVTPAKSKSQFEEERLLTPEEFVKAGDFLIGLCGSWSWSGGDEKKRVRYLPADKQFLVTRGVPCQRRVSLLEAMTEELIQDGTDEWVSTGKAWNAAADGEDAADIADISSPEPAAAGAPQVPELGDLSLQEQDEEEYKPPTEAAAPGAARRTYDLYITYDKYYQVPRFWLVGFSEDNLPLPTSKVLEDVSAEHAQKTITVDPFPFVASLTTASIHPCKHANVMKKLGDRIVETGKPFTVEHYLLLFLKFIASVIPTIEYDYTTSVGGV